MNTLNKRLFGGKEGLLGTLFLAVLLVVVLPLSLDIFRLNLMGKYLTFAIGCGIAGVAGAAFTTIGSTGPDSGSRYIVDTFLVVVFGGAASLLGTVASAFGIAQTQSISEFFLQGTMGKVATLLAIVIILMIRPQGLFASKVRRA